MFTDTLSVWLNVTNCDPVGETDNIRELGHQECKVFFFYSPPKNGKIPWEPFGKMYSQMKRGLKVRLKCNETIIKIDDLTEKIEISGIVESIELH
jgi:hypothetical protein